MLIRRLIMICSSFILSSGLISCSKDKKVVPDSFNANGIMSQNGDRSFQLGKDIQGLEVGGELTVSSLQAMDFAKDPIHFTVTSQCTDMSNNQMYTNEFHQQNSAVFKVINLLPEEILVLTKAAQVFCDFTLVAENSLSSKATSQLKTIEIKNILTFKNTDPAFIKDNAVIFNSVGSDVLALLGQETNIRLACREFSARMNNRTNVIFLNDLIQLGLSSTKPTQGQQLCRLYSKVGGAIELTAPFTLHLPSEMPVVTSSIPGIENLFEPQYERSVYRVSIYNPNSFPLKMKILRSGNISYYFQALYLVKGKSGVGPVRTRQVVWTGDVNLTKESLDLYFEVPAQKSITLNAVAAIGLDCSSLEPNRAAMFPINDQNASWPLYVGEAYGFVFDSKLVNLQNPALPQELDFELPKDLVGFTSPASNLSFWKIEETQATQEIMRRGLRQGPIRRASVLANVTHKNVDYCREF